MQKHQRSSRDKNSKKNFLLLVLNINKKVLLTNKNWNEVLHIMYSAFDDSYIIKFFSFNSKTFETFPRIPHKYISWQSIRRTNSENAHRVREKRLVHDDLNRKSSRYIEEKRLVHEEKRLVNEEKRLDNEEKRLVNEEKCLDNEEKRLVHEDLNRKASRNIEEKRLVHEDFNNKETRKLALFLSFIFVVTFIFFGRSGGQSIEMVLVEVRRFQNSINKLVLIGQVAFCKNLGEFVIPNLVWVLQKWGLFH